MDPWAPINGISLERYAELSAEVSDTQDPEKQAEIVGKLGVARADWEAAKAGWTARMQDMSLMGQVAMRYMPLYQAALAKKKGGVPQVSFEDYVAMSGCVPVLGFEGMLQHYKITSAQWTMISGHWTRQIHSNPQYLMFGVLVEQEAARIRAGGQPKPVNIGAASAAPAAAGAPAPMGAAPGAPGAPAMPVAPGMPGAPVAPGMPGASGFGAPAATPYAAANPYGAATPYRAGNPYANPYAQPQHFNAQMSSVGAHLGAGLSALGSALESFVEGAIGGFSIGARVMVRWSDGHRYPGTVTNVQPGQLEVAFPNGRRIWVPQACVSTIY